MDARISKCRSHALQRSEHFGEEILWVVIAAQLGQNLPVPLPAIMLLKHLVSCTWCIMPMIWACLIRGRQNQHMIINTSITFLAKSACSVNATRSSCRVCIHFFIMVLLQIDRFSAMDSVSQKDTKSKALMKAGIGKKWGAQNRRSCSLPSTLRWLTIFSTGIINRNSNAGRCMGSATDDDDDVSTS